MQRVRESFYYRKRSAYRNGFGDGGGMSSLHHSLPSKLSPSFPALPSSLHHSLPSKLPPSFPALPSSLHHSLPHQAPSIIPCPAKLPPSFPALPSSLLHSLPSKLPPSFPALQAPSIIPCPARLLPSFPALPSSLHHSLPHQAPSIIPCPAKLPPSFPALPSSLLHSLHVLLRGAVSQLPSGMLVSAGMNTAHACGALTAFSPWCLPLLCIPAEMEWQKGVSLGMLALFQVGRSFWPFAGAPPEVGCPCPATRVTAALQALGSGAVQASQGKGWGSKSGKSKEKPEKHNSLLWLAGAVNSSLPLALHLPVLSLPSISLVASS
uniref:Uncharacterized protein n=1 Tax=Amazona collaria TaxID=241587 RepID=A0A8B9G3M7_9PSIT